VAAVLVHTFCNCMGFPRFDLALQHRRRTFIMAAFVVGLAGFLFLLMPATDPRIFSPDRLPTFAHMKLPLR